MTTEDKINTPEELVAAREAKGLTPEDIHRQLKLHPRQVVAIETGNWEALPGIPFVRGTLRNYGKLIGADVEPLLQSIGGAVKAPELKPSATLDEPLKTSSMMGFGNGGSGSRWVWTGLVIAALLALALFFGRDGDMSQIPSLFGRSGESAQPAGETAAAGSPARSSSSGSTTESLALNPQGGTSGTSGAASAPAPAPAAPPAAAPAAAVPAVAPAPAAATATPMAAPPAAPAAPSPKVLAIQFEGLSWVDIRQVDGTSPLLYGTQQPQTSVSLDTTGPLTLTIGNADKVKLEYDGKPVPIKGQPGTGIAKLKLP